MQKGADAFRSIGEVAKLIGVAPHVLRYWETQFSQLKPMKRPDGRRYYRPEDVRLAAGLCEVLRDEGLTIRGARKMLARDRGESVRAKGAARLQGSLAADPSRDEQVGGAQPPAAATDSAQIDTPEVMPREEELADLPPSSPRSRHRHRRRNRTGDASLPLFPELDAATPDRGVWLAHLVALSAELRAVSPSEPRAARARPQLVALRNAIASLY